MSEQSAETILIIDDDVVVAQAFAMALRREGIQVWTAHSADDGLRDAQQIRPDAIILDFRMPLINGVGFLYRLREKECNRRTPVVVVTGEAALTDEVHAQLRELDADVRIKPVGLHDLISTTRALLHRQAHGRRVQPS